MLSQTNQALVRGTLATLPEFSHETGGRRFFRLYLETARLSGAVDRLPVIAPESVLGTLDPSGGGKVTVSGSLRSHNLRAEDRRRLLIFLYADQIAAEDGPDLNDITLRGNLCREPVYRKTPLGREICDIMLAVPRMGRLGDYIPCILWGRTAQCAAELPVGAQITLAGRLQSRGYVKVLPEGTEERTAYELSAMELEILEENF